MSLFLFWERLYCNLYEQWHLILPLLMLLSAQGIHQFFADLRNECNLKATQPFQVVVSPNGFVFYTLIFHSTIFLFFKSANIDEIFRITHRRIKNISIQTNIFFTFSIPAIKASTSASVLYNAKEARRALSIPNASSKGWAQ